MTNKLTTKHQINKFHTPIRHQIPRTQCPEPSTQNQVPSAQNPQNYENIFNQKYPFKKYITKNPLKKCKI